MIIKTDWRSKLGETNLESLLRIKVEGPELSKFAETLCSKEGTLWWNDKERYINQGKRERVKNVQPKQNINRFTNTYTDEFLGEQS